jgi:hypothetical protein
MTEDEIRSLADRVLRETLGAYGYESVEVISAPDHDEAPALFVRAILKPGSAMVRGEFFAAAHAALSQALLERGETRFPYLRMWHPDDERAEDDNRRRAS